MQHLVSPWKLTCGTRERCHKTKNGTHAVWRWVLFVKSRDPPFYSYQTHAVRTCIWEIPPAETGRLWVHSHPKSSVRYEAFRKTHSRPHSKLSNQVLGPGSPAGRASTLLQMLLAGEDVSPNLAGGFFTCFPVSFQHLPKDGLSHGLACLPPSAPALRLRACSGAHSRCSTWTWARSSLPRGMCQVSGGFVCCGPHTWLLLWTPAP